MSVHIQTIKRYVNSLDLMHQKTVICATEMLSGNWINVQIFCGKHMVDWGYAPIHDLFITSEHLLPEEAKRLLHKPKTFIARRDIYMRKNQFMPALPRFAEFNWSFDKLWFEPTREFRVTQIEDKIKQRLKLYQLLSAPTEFITNEEGFQVEKEKLSAEQVLVVTEADLELETIARLMIFTNSELTDKENWKLESGILRKQLKTCYAKCLVEHRFGYCHMPFEECIAAVKLRNCVLYSGIAFLTVRHVFLSIINQTYAVPSILHMTHTPMNLRSVVGLIKNVLYKPIPQTTYDTPPCIKAMLNPGVLNNTRRSNRYINNEGRFVLTGYLIKAGWTPESVQSLFDRRTMIVYQNDSDRRSHVRETQMMIKNALKSRRSPGCTAMKRWCPYHIDNVVAAQLKCGCSNPLTYKTKSRGVYM